MGLEITLGNIITIALALIGFVSAYASLRSKVDLNRRLINDIINVRLKRLGDLKKLFENRLNLLRSLMIAIRLEVKCISKLLSKLTGILEIYIKETK